MNLALFILSLLHNNEIWKFVWRERQIEPRFISMNIAVQTIITVNTGYLFDAYLEFA